jgi:hypothetical protein
MSILLDWLLICVSSIILYKSADRILKLKSKTVADYLILVIFVFNCFPVFLDQIVGLPEYLPWHYGFKIAMENELIDIIYSFYMLVVMLVIATYSLIVNKLNYFHPIEYKGIVSRSLKLLLWMLLVSPFLHVLFSGQLLKYGTYGTYSSRGLTSSFYEINSILVLLSLLSFCCLFFGKNRSRIHFVSLIVYSLFIIWIDGKRYIIVTMLVMFFFFYVNSVREQINRRSLVKVAILASLSVIIFYFIYAVFIKHTSDLTPDSMYMNYRVDFGRDDVTKFVLHREIIDRDPILEYRGQTILTILLMPIPREIWPDKPYPHYRYLSAELYGTTIYDIPSGMTPSLFEMFIANFSVIPGMVGSILFLLFASIWTDSCRSVPRKAIYLLLTIGTLTQSMDALLAYIIIAPIISFIGWLRSTLKWKHKQIYSHIIGS